jgi:glyoxylase-like metal-dependent hydrolase (beta-lactamase superfamily II)
MSNSGLVLDGDTALLIDTQFDLPPARTMLDALVDQVPNARIDVLVNTHADGDHTWVPARPRRPAHCLDGHREGDGRSADARRPARTPRTADR